MKGFGLLLCMVGAIGMGGCQRRQLAQVSPLPPMEVAAPAQNPVAASPPAPLWSSLTKTACFGSCPVFDVRIFSDGQVLWEGKRHVSRLGRYEAKAGPDWLASWGQAADTAGFFQLESAYPAHAQPVPDLPQTILYLDDGRRQHRVVDNADSPVRLQRLERFLLEKLEELEWKEEQK